MTEEDPERSGEDEAGRVDGSEDRDARLQALLRVDIAVPASELTDGPLAARRARRAPVADADSSPDDRDDAAPSAPVTPDEAPARSWPTVGNVVSAVVLLALFVAGIGLTWFGARTIRTSTEGEVRAPVTDPAAPGFEALVEPTPTLALIHDLDGEVDSITVLTLPNPSAGGGGVVFVPTRVIDDMPIFGLAPIEAAYDLGTAQVQAEIVGDLLGAGIGEVAVVDSDRWAGLVAPVAPLTIDNPDALEVDGELRFPAGEVTLEADDVGPYLEARVEGESDLARLFRHETFWQAWLDAVAEADGPAAVPGELETGVGRFVRSLAEGPVVLRTLPVEETSTDDFGDEPTFAADVEGIAALVEELIPLPRTPRPGVRPRVRVLNGTEDLAEAREVVPLLPPAGVAVVVVGNDRRLDHETTTIAYVAPEHQEAAEAIRDVLGVGEVVVDPRPSDVVDITVTLGADHD